MFSYFLSGLVMGLGAAGSIGPVNLEILRRGLTRGAGAAAGVGLGAVTIDCLYFTLSVLATRQIRAALETPWTMRLLLFGGGAVLVWLGVKGLRVGSGEVKHLIDGSEQEKRAPAASSRRNMIAAYPVGLLMTAANPVTVAFWISVAASMMVAEEPQGAWMRFAGVAIGVVGWVIFFVALIAKVRRFVTPGFLRGVNIFSGVTLLAFGFYAWWRLVHV